MLSSLIATSLIFLKDNLVKIIISAIAIVIFYLIYFLTATSLKKLKTSILEYYPFDLFFPEGGVWSIGYFLIAITILGILIYFMFKGNFYAGPA